MNDILRQKLQLYLDKTYPGARIDTEHTLGGAAYIRFELGGEQKNGTKKRVKQAVERVFALFNDLFPDASSEIFILIYDYTNLDGFSDTQNYLSAQFSQESFAKFYNQVESVNTRYYITDEKGNENFEKANAKVIVGESPRNRINISNILEGIANAEMGLDPSIDQQVYFFDAANNRAFHMYDDRGCYIWSDSADKIRDIYNKRKDWIVEFDRPEIDILFK